MWVNGPHWLNRGISFGDNYDTGQRKGNDPWFMCAKKMPTRIATGGLALALMRCARATGGKRSGSWAGQTITRTLVHPCAVRAGDAPAPQVNASLSDGDKSGDFASFQRYEKMLIAGLGIG